jgi:sodium/proline symporter
MLPSFIGYLIFVLVIGFVTMRLTKTHEDFTLGGRKLGPWVVALSAKASDFSAWLLIGLPGQAFKLGLAAVFAAVGCLGGTIFNWTVLSQRLRRATENLSATTLPDFFEAKYADRTHLLRMTSIVLIVVFFTLYVSAQCVGAGKILASAFNLSQIEGMAIGLGFIVCYTILGGFFAVCWTDFFQALIMLGALLLLPTVGLLRIGSFSLLFEQMSRVNANSLTWTAGATGAALVLGIILGNLAIGLGYPGQPHILARYMAIRDPSELKKSTRISIVWTVGVLVGAVGVGLVGLAFLGDLEDPEFVTISLAKFILPPWVAGIVVSASIAAMMSTVDSQLLVVASAVSGDIYKKLINPQASQRRLLMLCRASTVLIAVIAFLLGIKAEKLVFWLVLYAWGGLAASFGPALILSLLWRGVTKWGIWSGMISGAATVIVWYNVAFLKDLIYELLPAFCISLVVIVIVSKRTAAPSDRGTT